MKAAIVAVTVVTVLLWAALAWSAASLGHLWAALGLWSIGVFAAVDGWVCWRVTVELEEQRRARKARHLRRRRRRGTQRVAVGPRRRSRR